jgi:tetratricopeptide (TPR) repeat protein
VLYRDAGNIDLAIDAYERCLQIDPDSRNAGQVLFSLYLLGFCYVLHLCICFGLGLVTSFYK